MTTFLRAVLLLCAVPATLAVTCYYPDGTAESSPDMGPCNNTTPHSMCCNNRRTTSVNDVCNPNGVCSYSTPQLSATAYGREGCTDPTFTSPYCLKLCMENTPTERYASQTVLLTICADGTYCCGSNNATCCNLNQGVRLAANIFDPSSTTQLGQPTGSGLGGLNSDSSRPGATQGSSDMIPRSQLLVVGLAVGIPLGTVAVGTAIVALLAWRREQRLRRRMGWMGSGAAGLVGDDSMEVKYKSYGVHGSSIGGASLTSGMDGPSKPVELAGGGNRPFVAEVPG